MANQGKKVSRLLDGDRFRLYDWLKGKKEEIESRQYDIDKVIGLAAQELGLALTRDNVRSVLASSGVVLNPARKVKREGGMSIWRQRIERLEAAVQELQLRAGDPFDGKAAGVGKFEAADKE